MNSFFVQYSTRSIQLAVVTTCFKIQRLIRIHKIQRLIRIHKIWITFSVLQPRFQKHPLFMQDW